VKANQLVWALLLAGMAAVRLPAQTLQTLVSFNFTNGANPNGLTVGTDGNFYGTTFWGGSSNYGTVFKMTTSGTLTTLISFNYTNGANPWAALTLGNDGNFYGTTKEGGSDGGYGTVFQVTTNGVLTTLASFAFTNGANPEIAALTLGNDGNFYGTTDGGGNNNVGTVFMVTTNGTLTMLVSFSYTNGADPYGTLALGNDGNFYGTTATGGGSNDYGTVFKVTTNGTLTTLVSFSYTNGAYPIAGLTLDTDGNFYGTTQGGGNTNIYGGYGGGTIFQVMTNGTLTTLVSFSETNGAFTQAGLTPGTDGNFYGMTEQGGSGSGTVFQVTTNGVLTTLASFNYTNGASAQAGLTLGSDGNIYGTAQSGGITNYLDPGGCGTVFRLLLSSVVRPTLTLQFWSGYPLLSLYGTLGDTYTMEYTTDLTVPNWTPMLIVPNLSISPFQMIDPAGVGQPMRFYRAVQSQ
jgi:uncharacterized repeat protein (TIGR03803 family)